MFIKIPKGYFFGPHLAVIRLKDKDPKVHKDLFIRLRIQNWSALPKSVHLNPYYRDLGFKGDFPEAEFYSKNAVV